MPELPDIDLYVEKLRRLLIGKPILGIRFPSIFVLRTAVPPISIINSLLVSGVFRIGKQMVISFESQNNKQYYLVIHLMISGRLHWRAPQAKPLPKLSLAHLDFESGTLVLTEASKRRRASIHLVEGMPALAEFDKGGIDPLTSTLPDFARALMRENRTLKRALCNPRAHKRNRERLFRRNTLGRQTLTLATDQLAQTGRN